jgi:hypothetical protein
MFMRAGIYEYTILVVSRIWWISILAVLFKEEYMA